jgi:hypothetical protein
VLAIVAAAGSWRGSGLTGAALDIRGLPAGGYDDIWFDGDVADVYQRFATEGYSQDHTVRHPLVPLLARVPVRALLRTVATIEPYDAVRAWLAAIAAIWAALLYGTLRLAGCRLPDAILFTALGLFSAAAMHWMVVPETFSIASVTILATIAVAAAASRRTLPEWLTTAAVALSASATVTNLVFGALLAARSSRPRAVQIIANAVCVVVVLFGLQRMIYPSVLFPYGYVTTYRAFILTDYLGTPLRPLAATFAHSMLMPEVVTSHKPTQENYRILSVQRSLPGSTGAPGIIALLVWAAILGIGIRAAVVSPSTPLRTVLLGGLGAQLAINLVFGEETFLFSLQVLPVLVILAALGTLTRSRVLVLSLAGLLLVTAAVINTQQFARSIMLADEIRSGVQP